MRLIIISAVYNCTKCWCKLNHRNSLTLSKTRSCKFDLMQFFFAEYTALSFARQVYTSLWTKAKTSDIFCKPGCTKICRHMHHHIITRFHQSLTRIYISMTSVRICHTFYICRSYLLTSVTTIMFSVICHALVKACRNRNRFKSRTRFVRIGDTEISP